ncbi:unnamed protein product [Ectocarpus fasciculatus]
MRNLTEPKDGRSKVRRAVHGQHYSHNKGLGYSHIVYVNARGKPIRVETVSGRLSDRAAHTASRLFLEPDAFLTLRGDGYGRRQLSRGCEDGLAGSPDVCPVPVFTQLDA